MYPHPHPLTRTAYRDIILTNSAKDGKKCIKTNYGASVECRVSYLYIQQHSHIITRPNIMRTQIYLDRRINISHHQHQPPSASAATATATATSRVKGERNSDAPRTISLNCMLQSAANFRITAPAHPARSRTRVVLVRVY